MCMGQNLSHLLRKSVQTYTHYALLLARDRTKAAPPRLVCMKPFSVNTKISGLLLPLIVSTEKKKNSDTSSGSLYLHT